MLSLRYIQIALFEALLQKRVHGVIPLSDMPPHLIYRRTPYQSFLAQIPAQVARLLTNEMCFLVYALFSSMRGVPQEFMELG
jgi:hypothetical protein